MDSSMRYSDPSQSFTQERIAEIGALLAEALMRLRSRKSSDFVGKFGECSLHISPEQSGDAAELRGGEAA